MVTTMGLGMGGDSSSVLLRNWRTSKFSWGFQIIMTKQGNGITSTYRLLRFEAYKRIPLLSGYLIEVLAQFLNLLFNDRLSAVAILERWGEPPPTPP